MKHAAWAILLSACVTTPSPGPSPPEPRPPLATPADGQREAREVVEDFVAASEGGRFEQALALLSKPLRERYTPATLARDFAAEPYARDRLQLIKASAAKPWSVVGDQASLEWASGRSLRLAREGASWKITSLE